MDKCSAWMSKAPKDAYFICKPTGGSQGKGIFLVSITLMAVGCCDDGNDAGVACWWLCC